MKTVKEINTYLSDNRRGPIEKQQDLNLFLIDCIIGITEHLEAQQLAIPRAFGPLINPDDERRGMIAALRWVCDDCRGEKPMCGSETQARCHVPAAIARLESGGDL